MLNYNFPPEILAFSAGRDEELPVPVLQAHQVHTDKIAIIDSESITREELYGYDAMVTNLKNFAIGARTADCVPILLYDPRNSAVAAIHSGWKGTCLKISQKTIALMGSTYGTRTEELLAVIGPSIGPDSFQVGAEVPEAFREAGFPVERMLTDRGARVEGSMQGGLHFDLWSANRYLLEDAGIPATSIYATGICTYENREWYSARREGAKCGRNINAIMIR